MAKKKGNLPDLKPVAFTLPQDEAELDATLSIRLPKKLKDKLKKFSDKKGIKTNTLVRHVLEQFLEAQGA